jgi:hypothetical protein
MDFWGGEQRSRGPWRRNAWSEVATVADACSSARWIVLMVKIQNTFNNDPVIAPFAFRFCCLVAEDDAQAAALGTCDAEEVSQFFTESTPTPVFSEYR